MIAKPSLIAAKTQFIPLIKDHVLQTLEAEKGQFSPSLQREREVCEE
jgi:hypothetical protein